MHKRGDKGGFMLTETKKMTKKQIALVDTIVANGCTVKEASQIAGYAEGESGRVTASKTLRLPHVQQYMMQRVSESIGLSATTASKRLLDLARGAKSEYVQLEASKDILDRAGFKAPEKHMHLHAGDIKVAIDLT
jgi:phage terminase small subunit